MRNYRSHTHEHMPIRENSSKFAVLQSSKSISELKHHIRIGGKQWKKRLQIDWLVAGIITAFVLGIVLLIKVRFLLETIVLLFPWRMRPVFASPPQVVTKWQTKLGWIRSRVAKTIALRADCTRRKALAVLCGCPTIRLRPQDTMVDILVPVLSLRASVLEDNWTQINLHRTTATIQVALVLASRFTLEWNVLLRELGKQMINSTLYVTDEPCHLCWNRSVVRILRRSYGQQAPKFCT